MKQSTLILALGLMIFVLVGCRPQTTDTTLTVRETWIRAIGTAETSEHSMEMQAATPVASTGLTTAAFASISNPGSEEDRLLRIEAEVAETIELHLSEMKDDVMMMRPVEGIDIPAGETIELKPGGYHIMLVNLQQEIKPGEKYPLTFVFEKAGPLIVEADVRAP